MTRKILNERYGPETGSGMVKVIITGEVAPVEEESSSRANKLKSEGSNLSVTGDSIKISRPVKVGKSRGLNVRVIGEKLGLCSSRPPAKLGNSRGSNLRVTCCDYKVGNMFVLKADRRLGNI